MLRPGSLLLIPCALVLAPSASAAGFAASSGRTPGATGAPSVLVEDGTGCTCATWPASRHLALGMLVLGGLGLLRRRR